MRILAIGLGLPDPLSYNHGGANEKLLYYLMKGLVKHHEVHIVVNSKTVEKQPDELKSAIYFHGFDDTPVLAKMLFQHVQFALYLFYLDAKYNFEVIHSFSFQFPLSVLLFSKFKRKPIIFSENTHGPWIDKPKSFFQFVDFYINIVPAVRSAKIVTVPSNFIKGRIEKLTGISLERTIVIPYGLPFPSVAKSSGLFRKKNRLDKNSPILTFIGRSVPYKGIHNIIIALAALRKRFPCIKLVIAGPPSADFTSHSISNNPYREELLKLAENLNLSDSIIFTGVLSINELFELLADTSIFVFPSTEEAFGLVLIEALSMGLPIVTSKMPPMNEIVDSSNGRLVEPGNPGQIADAVSELLSNVNLFDQISKDNLKKFLKEYHVSSMINRYLDLYSKI